MKDLIAGNNAGSWKRNGSDFFASVGTFENTLEGRLYPNFNPRLLICPKVNSLDYDCIGKVLYHSFPGRCLSEDQY